VGFDLVGFLAQSSGRNLGILSNAAYVSGTGTTQPLGFLNGITVGVTGVAAAGGTASVFPTATATEYGADYLVDLYHSVIPQYRPRASWMMNDATIKGVRRLKDTLGRFIWEPSLQAGVPDTIMGKPVYANPAMPLTGVSVTGTIVFGDFSAYYIRDVTPLRFERSDEYLFGSDQIAFRALLRTDGALVDANALRAYATPAT
jgi:HK97 family phage major capsid protein